MTKPASIVISLLVVLWPTSTQAQIIVTTCVDEQTREQVRALVIEGLDQALRSHMSRVFEIWVRDIHERPPRRATAGMNLAVNAYILARAGAMRWDPPICP